MPTTAKGTPYVVSTDLVANYPTVSSDLADHIDDNLAYNAVSINAQTGTTYTFALADASEGKLVTASNAAASTYTVPPQSSVTWVAGAVLRILNQGAGVVTLAAGSGVTVNGGPLTLAQYDEARIFRTASNTWTVVNSASGGLVKITDSTFSAVTAISLNNCFSATYTNYKFVLSSLTASQSTDLRMRMRASGSDATGAQYNTLARFTAGTTSGDYRVAGGTAFALGAVNTGFAFGASGDFMAPNLAELTNISFTYVGRNPLPDSVSVFGGHVHYVATAYDGFTIYPEAGTITGTIRVYGYRN